MEPTSVADALTAFAEALEGIGIAPAGVEVTLPLEDWQGPARRLDEEMPETAQDIGKLEVGRVRYLIRQSVTLSNCLTRRVGLSLPPAIPST